MKTRGELNKLKSIKYLYTNLPNKITHLIASNIHNIIDLDCPDGYIICNDTCIIIEHFEISATYSNRNGTVYNRELSILHKKWNVKHDLAKYDESIDYLYKSIEYNLTNHNKFKDYRQNLLNEGIIHEKTKVINVILMEDKSLSLACQRIFNSWHWVHSCVLFNNKVLHMLRKYDEFDYVIYQDVMWIKNKSAYIIKNNIDRNYHNMPYIRTFYKGVKLDMTIIKI